MATLAWSEAATAAGARWIATAAAGRAARAAQAARGRGGGRRGGGRRAGTHRSDRARVRLPRGGAPSGQAGRANGAGMDDALAAGCRRPALPPAGAGRVALTSCTPRDDGPVQAEPCRPSNFRNREARPSIPRLSQLELPQWGSSAPVTPRAAARLHRSAPQWPTRSSSSKWCSSHSRHPLTRPGDSRPPGCRRARLLRASMSNASDPAAPAPAPRRATITDRHGRRWTIASVPLEHAQATDLEFWLQLTPEQRVDAMGDCLLDWLKARGIDEVPRLRRVSRRAQRTRR